MRCLACDKALTDFESTRRDVDGKFVDLCNDCVVRDSRVYSERNDLLSEDDFSEGHPSESDLQEMRYEGEAFEDFADEVLREWVSFRA